MTDTEKAALERRIDELCAEVEYDRQTSRSRLERIDELCAEVERLHADKAHWELGNCPSCPNIADLQEALEQNAKLRGQYEAVIADYRSEVAKLRKQVDYMTPIALYAASERERDSMHKLGIEVDENVRDDRKRYESSSD